MKDEGCFQQTGYKKSLEGSLEKKYFFRGVKGCRG
jgi:hypothetical protein